MRIFTKVAVMVIIVMIFFAPYVRKNLKKEHYKSLMIAIIPLIVFLMLAYIVIEQVGS